MNLCAPTNWQPGLLDKMDKSRVLEIYGKLSSDPVGGGRPSFMLPHIDKSKVKDYILNVHEYGLKFNYLLNATCLGNIEWSVRGQKSLRSFLDWLSAIGVDTVTVSIPYLMELAKKHYPHFKTKVSVCAQVSDPFQARYWESLGADEIALSPWRLNRDFETLKVIRQAVKCGLQIYANTRCLRGCPFVQYHYSSHSHSSRTGDKESTINYCKFSCNYLLLEQPWRLIASSWIRPEDLHYYEEIGINTVKLSERGMTTEQILRIVSAYTKERYEGNLMELLCVIPGKRLALGKKRRVKVSPLSALLNQMLDSDPTFLDNSKLDGFLKFFVNGKCRGVNCDGCGYCQSIADKALSITEDYRAKSAGIYKDLIKGIIGPQIFTLLK
jgi:collagenase-like PrtC family protease